MQIVYRVASDCLRGVRGVNVGAGYIPRILVGVSKALARLISCRWPAERFEPTSHIVSVVSLGLSVKFLSFTKMVMGQE